MKMLEESKAAAEYQSLLTDICKIYEDAKDSTLIAINKIRNRAYWLIGERIIQVEQKGEIKARYGTRLIENLSRDLSFKYSNGFSETNLRSMRKFYLSHTIQQPSAELSWSHHKLLLTIQDPKKRKFFERKSLENDWSMRELRKILAENKVELEEPQPEIILRPRAGVHQLEEERGFLDAYQLKLHKHGRFEEPRLFADFGFSMFREVHLPEILEWKAFDVVKVVEEEDGALTVKKADILIKKLFTFKAYVDRVVDGDTLLLDIDCGYGTWITQRIRLRSVDCPPVQSQRGKEAKAFVEEALGRVDFVVIKTYRTDKYDRYIADVFYYPGQSDPHLVADEGHLLNQELLDQGLADLY